jgi:hypothetical protein
MGDDSSNLIPSQHVRSLPACTKSMMQHFPIKRNDVEMLLFVSTNFLENENKKSKLCMNCKVLKSHNFRKYK